MRQVETRSEKKNMREIPQVVIAMARCRNSKKAFGIRVEERGPSQWVADWAFSIPENKASKEGYGHSEISGTFAIDSQQYPGCPHCHARLIVKCSCGGTACWDGEQRKVSCPWCGAKGVIGGEIESLSAGNDR